MTSNSCDYLYKLLIIGDSGVGKSCIMARFTDGTFNSTFISTIGIDFKTKNIDLQGKLIKLQVWDTAGQERFHTITTLYYRGATGIFLVYDITDLKSFQNISRWSKQVDELAKGGVVKCLIGNKCDMEAKREVSKATAQLFAKANDMLFQETSAKDNVNIDSVFLSIAKLIYEKGLKSLPEPIVQQQSQPKSKCCLK